MVPIYHRKMTAGSCLERIARSGSRNDNEHGSVGAMNAELSRLDLLATVNRHNREYVRWALDQEVMRLTITVRLA